MESKPSVSKNDVQRLFLQAVFSRGVLSEKLAMVIWAKCKDAVRGKHLMIGVRLVGYVDTLSSNSGC